MNELLASPLADQPGAQAHPVQQVGNSSVKRPAVIVIAPPWPRSGTARVVQNQIDYYRQRGFQIFFVGVPFLWVYMNTHHIWDDITQGIQDFGADREFIAALELRSYNAAKYVTSLRHAFRGTALDWQIGIARCTRLPADAIRLFRDTPIALLHVNHVYTLGFALRLRRKLTGRGARVPIILDTHDIQSHLLLERGDINPWTRKQDSLERLVKSEIAMTQKADVLIHLSVDDIKFFQSHLPKKPHILSLPTIDESFVAKVKAAPPQAETIDLLFVGQSHAPNLAALKWFFEEVWPLIGDRGYRLTIVGQIDMFVRIYAPEIHQAFRSNFVGPVAELAPLYRAARCVFAPMVSGTGISIKTIEALALGKPFVGTSKAYRGMPMDRIEQAGLHAYDTPQAFADAIAHALSDEQGGAAASRAAYDNLFSKQAAFSSREEAFRLARAARNRVRN